jgi:uncharacterized protein YdhG (YjbR/CyaY superfamily)
MAQTQTSAKSTGSPSKSSSGWSEEEKSAARERTKELKAQAKRGEDREAGLKDVLGKIAEMPPSDRVMAERIHAIVSSVAPDLDPKTWYGMPAYAKNGKLICFFKSADKFKSRYATFGFEENARLDDGSMWPTSYALTKLTAADEARIAELVKKAAG